MQMCECANNNKTPDEDEERRTRDVDAAQETQEQQKEECEQGMERRRAEHNVHDTAEKVEEQE